MEYLFQQNEISKAAFRPGAHLKILDLNGVQCVEADLLDHHSLHEAVEGTDTVYSMASPGPGGDGALRSLNTEGITNLLEVSREAGVETVVHLSTIDVCGFGVKNIDESTPPNPSDDYQKAKAAAEAVLLEFARKNGTPRVVVVRAAKAVGPRDWSLTVPLLRMIRKGSVVLPRGGEMSFTHPKDIAKAMYKAASDQKVPNGVYMVKSFDSTPEELATALVKSIGADARVARAGVFSRPDLPQYTARQLGAAPLLAAQPSWGVLGYSPEYDRDRTCAEVAAWYAKESWVAEEA